MIRDAFNAACACMVWLIVTLSVAYIAGATFETYGPIAGLAAATVGTFIDVFVLAAILA